ncbi:hypothetical protein C8Q74DRAFT_510201 [Fomes fomentarius]|nr:hypothetical protein C8Q74DRAFT_510201 [Fomes fomentarius]
MCCSVMARLTCFSFTLILNILVTVLTIVDDDDMNDAGQCLAVFRDSFSSILISHFLLDLKKLGTDDRADISGEQVDLTIQFASDRLTRLSDIELARSV